MTIHSCVKQIISLLHKYNADQCALILEGIISVPNKSEPDLKAELCKCFGGMGSLTDVSLYVEGDPQKTRKINKELDSLCDQLFELVKE